MSSGMRDSFGTLVGDLVDSFPIELGERASISDLGKVLFNEGQGLPPTAQHPLHAEQERQLQHSVLSKRCRTNSQSKVLGATNGDTNDFEGDQDHRNRSALTTEIKGVPRQKHSQSQQYIMGINGQMTASRQTVKIKGKAAPKRWTAEEDEALRSAVKVHGEKNWKAIAAEVPFRNHTQCLQRWTKVLAPGLVKGHWRPEEDDMLCQLVAEGRKNWGQVAARIPGRTSKQCRERWYNHLDPNIVRGEYSAEEDRIIIEAQARLGNRWSAISAMLPGRTEDAVKIRWKSLCRSRSGRNRNNANNAADRQKINTGVVEAQKPPVSRPTFIPQVHQHPSYVQPPSYVSPQASPSQEQRIRDQQNVLNHQKLQMVKQEMHLHEMLKLEDHRTGVSPHNSLLNQPLPTPLNPPAHTVPAPNVTVHNPAAHFAAAVQQQLTQPPPIPSYNPAAAFARSMGGTAAAPPTQSSLLNPAAAFAQAQAQSQAQHNARMRQLQQAQQQVLQQQHNQVNYNGSARPPVVKKARASTDAARASAARRMRNSENGRNSLEGFLNDLGDMGRFSDMELGDMTGMDGLWRVSDDMNRLSL